MVIKPNPLVIFCNYFMLMYQLARWWIIEWVFTLRWHCVYCWNFTVISFCLLCLFFIWTMGTLVHLATCTCSWVHVIFPPPTPFDQYTTVAEWFSYNFLLLVTEVNKGTHQFPWHMSLIVHYICVTMNGLHCTVSTLQMVSYKAMCLLLWWIKRQASCFNPSKSPSGPHTYMHQPVTNYQWQCNMRDWSH
jgi:hypothetical protein